ncbi:MAG: class I SAM-dependent DNA methyltransferase [Fimbriiglobus sp.]
MFRRAWQSWRRKDRLVEPLSNPRGLFFAPTLQFRELRAADGGTEVAPYSAFAEAWHAHSRDRVPDYPYFLRSLAEERGLKLDAILDLACGTGVLTDRLAALAPAVVGVDGSAAMLAKARREYPTGTFVHADFRDFRLDQRFDAAVCASNSLNYVRDLGELRQVFAAVAAHLRPGGLFLFDTTPEAMMKRLSGLTMHSDAGGGLFAVRFRYDPTTRREEARVLVAAGAETHRRIPLDPPDVTAAAAATGLTVLDYFSQSPLVGRLGLGLAHFFVLAKPAGHPA